MAPPRRRRTTASTACSAAPWPGENLTASRTRRPATPASYAYTLGPAGNRTQIAEASGRRVDYAYDDLFRLTGETVTPAGGGAASATSYSYDAVGNRTHKVDSTGTTDYSYDLNN